MFCNIPQVNQLTSLLLAHAVRHIVVCPGSRNATLAHNFHELAGQMHLYPVTDERSAAFVALGLSLATGETAAVCVTSGSALLGCLPAVAEAYYRHLPLLVISADRPPQWVGQLDGQTLPQPGALLPYCPTARLCIPHTDEAHWANNRLINEALLSLHRNGGRPAHINVPIAEPMFSFTTERLPEERVIREYIPATPHPLPQEVLDAIAGARLPALVMGLYERGDLRKEVSDLDTQEQMLVLPEIISDVAGSFRMNTLDALQPSETGLLPDLVVQVGGNFVHKRFKRLLREGHCRVIRIGYDDTLADTFCGLETVIRCHEAAALVQLTNSLPHHHSGVRQARQRYEERERNGHGECGVLPSAYTEVLLQLRKTLELNRTTYSLHLANSTAVRAAAHVFRSGEMPVFCNRGVNGIEGSLSTSVGYALGMWGLAITVIGDLSFFYDCNALWNTRLPANLRILLLNDGHGGIFDRLPGLEESPARDTLIAAGRQHFTAQGIAASYGIGYHTAGCAEELPQAIETWLQEASTAQILEVPLPRNASQRSVFSTN